MPSKSPRSSKAKSGEPPPTTTNFRQIKGINQLIEARLHRAGINTFEDLGHLQPEEVLSAIGQFKGVTVKQIIEQDWIGQARKLAGKKPAANGAIESEGFIVNLFLSKKKQVHSTQILHVNSDEGEKWDGWDSQRLLDFITKRSGLVLPVVAPVKVAPLTPEPIKLEIPAAPISQPAESVTAPEPTQSVPPQEPEIILRTFEMIPSHSQTPSKLLRIGEPFDVRLAIDPEKATPQFATALNYSAALFAKGLDTEQRLSLGEVKGVLASPDEAIVVNIPKQDFAPGTYRLEAALTISKGVHPIGKSAQARTIFQVF